MNDSFSACPEYFTNDFHSDDSDPTNKLRVQLTFHMYGGKARKPHMITKN